MRRLFLGQGQLESLAARIGSHNVALAEEQLSRAIQVGDVTVVIGDE